MSQRSFEGSGEETSCATRSTQFLDEVLTWDDVVYATEVRPSDAEPWYSAGVIHMNLGDDAEALGCFAHACELDPQMEIAWANKAAALFGLKRHSEAVAAAAEALKLDPADAIARVMMAQA